MIVAVCGAYRNAGDHLIGARGRALLRKFVDSDVVTVDRRSITTDAYELFNKARAVILCGGPAYQAEMYPKVYPIERQKVGPKIVPFGLGWKSSAAKAPEKFKFHPDAMGFIRDIHSTIEISSARDPLTVEVLNLNDVSNVAMTGCPVWYDLDHLERAYTFAGEPKRIALSMPALMQPGVFELTDWLTKRFPKAARIATFHHGIVPNWTPRGRSTGLDFLKFSAWAAAKGWRVSSLAGSLDKMEGLYGSVDLHIGYRVHAHLLCLSRRIPSILINEDARGVGQAKALGSTSLVVGQGEIEPIVGEIERLFSERGAPIEKSVEIMRGNFKVMRQFLATI
jgi:hypothetical protein